MVVRLCADDTPPDDLQLNAEDQHSLPPQDVQAPSRPSHEILPEDAGWLRHPSSRQVLSSTANSVMRTHYL